jgi:hypothetical protein
MYRHGEILTPSHRSVTVQSLPVPTGPIIDIYPSFDRPQPKKPARRAARPARPFPRLWLWLALAIAAAISAIIALRGQIVDAVPSLAPAYSAVGLPVADANLHLGDVRVIGVYGRDELSISIQGEVVNSAGRQLELPTIELSLRAVNGRILETRTIEPGRAILDPGATYRFATEIVDPPPATYDITVRIGSGPAEIFDFL